MNRNGPRGFTLIELMVVVTIIGLLSTVALPVYKRATLRARVAERSTMLQSINMAIQDAYNRGVIPAGGVLTGLPNPAAAPSPDKHSFDLGAAGWRDISLVVQGDCYYSYGFQAAEALNGVDAAYQAGAVGDLDGDTVQSFKTFDFVRTQGHWALVNEWPPAGAEDDATYRSF